MKSPTRFLAVATALFLCLAGTEACRRPLHSTCPDSPLTATPVPTDASPTVTRTVTITPTLVPTSSPTNTPTGIVTPSVSPSFTPTPTRTETTPPTDTPTFLATDTETATTTSTPPCLYISSPTTILAGTYHYSCVELDNPGQIYIDGEGVTLNVDNYYTSSGSCSIYGQASTLNSGSPIDIAGHISNAGAGHGGTGGADGRGDPGGSTYDSATDPIYPGSIGGLGQCSGNHFNGGSAFRVNVLNGPATLTGTINMSGIADYNCGSNTSTGGGSGGTIYIQADRLEGEDLYLAAMGAYGPASSASNALNAGGGGGGIIALSYHTANHLTNFGTSVAGGIAVAPAQKGSDGVFNITTY